MYFYRWQFQMRRYVFICELLSFINGFTNDHLSCQGAAGNGRATSEGLELCVGDNPILDLHLQFDHIATRSFSDQRGANTGIVFVESTNVPGIVEVVMDCLMIASWTSSCQKHALGQPCSRAEPQV